MEQRKRLYTSILREHIRGYRQMAFVSGPRQVGKTTTYRSLGDSYLDWDNDDHREIILTGPAGVATYAGLDRISDKPVVVVFDELHKYERWKLFLKGFFDTYEDRVRVIVTGSSRLDVYRHGGDSLMGRYFLFHMHPLSAAELINTGSPDSLLRSPRKIPAEDWQALWDHGGYPEPFVRRDQRFSARWLGMRQTQLLREEIRDLTRIQQLDQMATLGQILAQRSGQQIVYGALARRLRVSENTVRSWIATLCSLHYGFLVRPWHRNVNRALRKEPKWFLRDWSGIKEEGKRAESFCACHLLKAVELWTDLGFGSFELRYIRDKQQREVDFLVVRDGEPWFLVEVKSRSSALSPLLGYFQKQIHCPHAFQVVTQADYVDKDCFTHTTPVIVPARTLLSQLL